MANDDLFDKLSEFISKGAQNIRDRLTLDVTDLLRAVDQSDPDAVARALQARVDPNATDGIRRRALPIAVDNNHLLIVRLLLKAGANPNLADPYGDTPLYKAVYWENEEIVTVLLAAGADINQPTSNNISPLQEAQKNGYTALAELLTNFHSQAREDQIATDTATHEAMKEKARVAREKREKETAEKRAAAEKARIEAEQQAREAAEQKATEKYVVEDGNYSKALLHSIIEEDSDSAKVLLEKTTDLNAFDPQYKTTPLLAAIQKKNTQLIQLLVEKGANCLDITPQAEHSALGLAVNMNAHKLAQYILEKHADTAAAALNDPQQLLSLQFIAYKDSKMLNILLNAGADPYFGGQHGQAPFIKAIEKGSLGILPVLTLNEVDLNLRYEGNTPLEWAIHFQRKEWVSALLDEDVAVDTRGETGQTPLLFAVENNYLDGVELLLEADADPELTDSKGRNALELGRELGVDAAILDQL